MELRFPVVAVVGVLAVHAPGQTALSFDELRRMLPVDTGDTWAVALGDVDGDGDLDTVIGNGSLTSGQQNRLWLNDGTGRFRDATAQVPTVSDQTFAVALGDVDGDGDLDAVIGNGDFDSGQQNRLWLNDGTGRFTDATALVPTAVDRTRAVALGDADGDGDLDALIGNWGQNRLWLNDGTGRFNDAPALVPTDSDQTRAVALGDVDVDGDLDALIGNGDYFGQQQQNRLWLNDGTGRFSDATARVPTALDYTEAVALGDVDGDGDLDAVIGNSGPVGLGFLRQNRLWINDGTGRFSDATAQIPTARDYTNAVALGDVDGDGDLDVLVGNSGQQLSRLWINDGAGRFTRAATQIPATRNQTLAVALGDVDGDGDLDAVIGNTAPPGLSRQNRLWLNDGTARFSDATAQIPSIFHVTQAVALGDVDGDGDLDALIGRFEPNGLWLNDGTGRFSEAAAQVPTDGGDTRALALGDVDGDGDLDAVIGNHGSVGQWRQNRLWLNDGTGRFRDATARVPTDSDYTEAVALGDVDGDGDLDAVIGNSGQNRLWLNDGTARFSDATAQIPAARDSTNAVALGDVDGDGDLDVLVGNSGQQLNRLWINDGAGRFTRAATQIPATRNQTSAVALGDVDGDGDLDAVIGNSNGQNRLWLNDGTGRFSDAPARVPTLWDWTRAAALGDVDGDGDLDAVIGNNTQQNRLWLNDGTGLFTEATDLVPTDSDITLAVALGDVDGDRDLDAVIGNSGQNRVHANLTRQIAWRALPRIGKPLTVDVYGSPFGVWLLLASLGTADIRLPIGTLRLDPSLHVQVGAGLLDRGGRAAVAHDVPDEPSLIGRSLYWQAVVTVPIALTNLETTTFTNL